MMDRAEVRGRWTSYRRWTSHREGRDDKQMTSDHHAVMYESDLHYVSVADPEVLARGSELKGHKEGGGFPCSLPGNF